MTGFAGFVYYFDNTQRAIGMGKLLMAFAGVAGMATAACDIEKAPAADAPAAVSIAIDSGSDATSTGDNKPGKVEIILPGGIAAKVDLPEGLENREKLKIAGVGLYPGARLASMKVNADAAATSQTAQVEFGFAAPGDAAAVADWYQSQFEANGTAVTRRGETLSGTASDGDRFTIAMAPAGTGKSRGVLTIRNTN